MHVAFKEAFDKLLKNNPDMEAPWDPNSLYPPIYIPLREFLKKRGQNYFNENSISLRKFTIVILLSSVNYDAFCQRAEFAMKASLSPNVPQIFLRGIDDGKPRRTKC